MISLAVKRNEKAETAYNLYMRGEKLVDIAKQLGVPEGTIRRWKHDHKWDGERSGKKGSERSDKKRAKKIAPEVKALIENEDLTEKEKLFCIEYVKCFNGARAARKAGYSPTSDRKTACKLLHMPKINAEIQRLKLGKLNRAMLTEDDVFQKMIDIAFADISDYVEFRRENVPINRDGKTEKQPVNRVWFKSSENVDASLISEVKQGRDGASIKLYDKMRALEWLAARLDLLPTDVRLKLDIERQKANADENTKKIDICFTEKPEDEGWHEA